MNQTQKIIISCLLIAFGLTSCDFMVYKNKPGDESDLNVNRWNEAKHPNLVPMYGDHKKSAVEKAKDKEYIDAMIKDHGDLASALKVASRWGWYYFSNGVIDTAMFRFNQCWLLDSTRPESYFGFAAIREYQRLNDEADMFYEMAYKHDTSDSLSIQNLNKIAEIKEKQNDTAAIFIAYTRSYTKFRANYHASGKLGFYYSTVNKPDSSIKYYNVTIDLIPEYFQTYINRGWQYRQEGKIENAINDFSMAIQKNNISPHAYANRYSILMQIERYEDATSDIKRCIELVPKEPGFHKDLAECYFQLGMIQECCAELDVAITLGGEGSEKLKTERCP